MMENKDIKDIDRGEINAVIEYISEESRKVGVYPIMGIGGDGEILYVSRHKWGKEASAAADGEVHYPTRKQIERFQHVLSNAVLIHADLSKNILKNWVSIMTINNVPEWMLDYIDR